MNAIFCCVGIYLEEKERRAPGILTHQHRLPVASHNLTKLLNALILAIDL
jgi:hypothetical protein